MVIKVTFTNLVQTKFFNNHTTNRLWRTSNWAWGIGNWGLV